MVRTARVPHGPTGATTSPVGQLGVTVLSKVLSKTVVIFVVVSSLLFPLFAGTSLAGASTRPWAAPATPPCGVRPGAGVTVSGSPSCLVTLDVGTTFVIELGSGLQWSGLHSTSPAVAVSNQVAVTGGGLTATATATAPGSATLSAYGAPICAPGTACPQIVMLWTLDVVVSARTPPAAFVVTRRDAGHHVTVARGQRVVVRLSGVAGVRWSEPMARPAARLRRIGGASGNVASAVFVAVQRGVVTVTSSETYACSPTCLAPVRRFTVTIRVA